MTKFLERLSFFKENALGLPLDNKVRHLTHNLNWSKVFRSEVNLIFTNLGIESLKPHHCGSVPVECHPMRIDLK